MALSYHTRRWRKDPEYRKRRIAQIKAYQQRNAHDAGFVRLVDLRKAIYCLRESIDRRQRKTREMEVKLFELIRERDQIIAERNEKRLKIK